MTRDPIALAWLEAHPSLAPGALVTLRGDWHRSLGYGRGGYVVLADCRYDDRAPALTHHATVASVTVTGLRVRETCDGCGDDAPIIARDTTGSAFCRCCWSDSPITCEADVAAHFERIGGRAHRRRRAKAQGSIVDRA